MLVIRRRVGETVLIGDEVEVEVLESSGSQVKLGIRAPRAVGVVRKELRVVGEQNRAAAEQRMEAGDLEKLLKQFKNPEPVPIRPV